jgi:hypothetical protein
VNLKWTIVHTWQKTKTNAAIIFIKFYLIFKLFAYVLEFWVWTQTSFLPTSDDFTWNSAINWLSGVETFTSLHIPGSIPVSKWPNNNELLNKTRQFHSFYFCILRSRWQILYSIYKPFYIKAKEIWKQANWFTHSFRGLPCIGNMIGQSLFSWQVNSLGSIVFANSGVDCKIFCMISQNQMR